MKAPPKRKGNAVLSQMRELRHHLNESPSEKEGKLAARRTLRMATVNLNESPSEKEGKFCDFFQVVVRD